MSLEPLRRCTRRLGHRGAFLLALGVLDELYALSIPGVARTGTTSGLWLATVAPLSAWTIVWAVTGVVLIAGAFVKHDWWAFGVAEALKVMWASVYLSGWLAHGVTRGWASAAVWTAFAVAVLIVSTWPERQWPVA